jgi:hypothetical protein
MLGQRMGKISRIDVFDRPAEQLIALGRMMFCALSLAAMVVDPSAPFQRTRAELTLLVAYSAFAIVVLMLRVWRVPYVWTAYIIHSVDIAVLTTLLFWAKDQVSTFFAVFMLLQSGLAQWCCCSAQSSMAHVIWPPH